MINILRVALRKTLGSLSKLAIRKHKPIIIVIVGDQYPTIIRESIYNISSTKYNSRQNIERSEREFSMPLTILGVLYYPKNPIEWIYILVKASIQLIYIKPYKHLLVLQTTYINSEIYKYWIGISNPLILITLDNEFDYFSNISSATKTISIGKSEISLISEGKYTKDLKTISALLEIDETEAKDSFTKNHSPRARINFILGKNDSFIIDARHYYHPPNLESVLEITEEMSGNKYVFTSIDSDKKLIPNSYTILKSQTNIAEKGAVYIFRGSKTKYKDQIKRLTLSGAEI